MWSPTIRSWAHDRRPRNACRYRGRAGPAGGLPRRSGASIRPRSRFADRRYDEIRPAHSARRSLCRRSEEHTSDSSHVEISYAVFCLKKKKKKTSHIFKAKKKNKNKKKN